jgi:hypothetical protein
MKNQGNTVLKSDIAFPKAGDSEGADWRTSFAWKGREACPTGTPRALQGGRRSKVAV